MTFLAETPPVCGKCYDRDPFCSCAAPAPVAEQPDPAELLRAEHLQVAEELFAVLKRHEERCGCGGGVDRRCDLQRSLLRTWCELRDLVVAMDWLLGKDPSLFGARGGALEVWVREYFAGPWPDLGATP